MRSVVLAPWRWSIVILCAVAACGELKSAGEDVVAADPVDPQAMPGGGPPGATGGSGADGGASSSSSGGASSSSSGGTSSGGTSSGGPVDVWAGMAAGPFGPKPTGLCCANDAECRSGRCVRIGQERDAVSACADTCTTSTTCERPGPLSFVCYPQVGVCAIDAFEPQNCIPPATFSFGTKPLGACCTEKADGTNGLECASGVCVSHAGGPGVCTRTCAGNGDCATGFTCQGGPRGGRCVPASAAYTCK